MTPLGIISLVAVTVLACHAAMPTTLPAPGFETPRFEDLPVSEQLKGKPAAVRLTGPEARRYRTVIRVGAREGPNFAGHYTIVEWGCGAGCVQFAIVDAKTGSVFMPPFYVGPCALVEGETGEPEKPLQYRIDSMLSAAPGTKRAKGFIITSGTASGWR